MKIQSNLSPFILIKVLNVWFSNRSVLTEEELQNFWLSQGLFGDPSL